MIILFLVTLVSVTGVHINELSVPAMIKNGTEEFVTLDCDYTIEEAERPGLVVKWFFGELPVYQWIPNQKPQDFGILKGKVNLDYKASQDVYKMHRALQILKPSVNLTGMYLCRVSTFAGEAYKAATMIVFAPAKDMGINVVDSPLAGPGHINLSCWASGVFPEPRLTLYHGENKEQKVEDIKVETRLNKGTYDIRAYKILEDANLSSSSASSVFDCEISIPKTDYAVRRSASYEPGSLELKGRPIEASRGNTLLVKRSTSAIPSQFLLMLTFVLVENWLMQISNIHIPPILS